VAGTTLDVWSILVLLGLAGLALVGAWLIVPYVHGLPWDPAPRKRIRKALELANVQPGETVYDLGAGDGRALIVAAREFEAQAVGVEIEPVHCAVAWLWALVSGVIRRVSIRRGDLFQAHIEDADVVLLYLNPAFVERVRPKLEMELRPGARVVSLYFDFDGWQPVDVDVGYLIFLYHMPPTPGNVGTYLRQSAP
jgi:SAM-dependent methyltransferase